MKEVFALAGIAGVIIAVLYILGKRSEHVIGAPQTDNTSDSCMSVGKFINTVEEGIDFALPQIEGQGSGGFSGWRVNATGYASSPNTISGTGAAVAVLNPSSGS